MKNVSTVTNHKDGLLQAALAYAAMGWHVFPVHSVTENGFCTCNKPTCDRQGKHPRTPSGLNDATTSPEKIHHWWRSWPDANIGIRTGNVSGIFVVDVDSHAYYNGKDGEATMERLEREQGKLPDTIEVLTGGMGGRHLYYQYPPSINGIKSRSNALGDGIDVRGDGGYAIAPPSAGVGRTYEWEGSSDPFDGVAIADAPDWLIRRVERTIASHDGGDYAGAGSAFLDPKTAAELRDALTHIDPDEDYDQWAQVGMALKSTDAGEDAFEIWDTWSQRGAKYNPQEMSFKWRSFSSDGGINKETIFYLAATKGWVNPLAGWVVSEDKQVTADAALWKPGNADDNDRLFELPGKLGELFKWAISCAHRPQPHLAVNAILAGMSAIMGRRYRTRIGNWPALYFMNVAKSGAGKEHAKWVVEEMLDAAGLSERISGSGYTSSSAVLSQLRARPAHTTIIDELGKAFGSAQAKNNQHRIDALTSLMEAWGRCDGVMRVANYSTMGVSRTQAADLDDNHVANPSITLLGMTTPDTLYDSMSISWIKDGFLPRFIVVESPIGRQMGSFPEKSPIPQPLVDWLQSIANPPGGGNLAGYIEAHDIEPVPNVVLFDAEANGMIREFEARTLDLMDKLEQSGIEAAVGRDVEKAMRLAMLVGARPGPFTIGGAAMRWAIEYIEHHSRRLIETLGSRLHEGEFGALKQHVLDLIRRAGERGMTQRELNKYSRKFYALKPREQNDVIIGLQQSCLIDEREIPTKSGRGRKRKALVAIDVEESIGCANNADNADKTQTNLSAFISHINTSKNE